MLSSNKLCLFIFSACCIFYGCSSSRSSASGGYIANTGWQSNELMIDGNDRDWPATLPFYDEKLKLSYAITNDQTNLYLLLRTNNEQLQQQILRGGLTVLFNTHGVKDIHGAAGISFPTGNIRQKDNLLGGRSELGDNKTIALSNAQDYSLFGFSTVKTVENFDYGKSNPEGIELGIGFSNAGGFVYEAVVPLTALYNHGFTAYPAGRSIAICFQIEDLPPTSGQRNSRSGGLSIGGGIGFGSFGMGSGMGLSIGTGALGGGGRRSPKQTKIWQELVFVKAPVVK
jgi:hypothetical protein